MGILSDIQKQVAAQFIEVIHWLDDSPDTLVYRFPVKDQEIKMGAKLTVRENQVALVVSEGVAADLFVPGLHELSTRNIPVLTKLRAWTHGFESPFKAEVYFFNTRLYVDLKWGTPNPVMMRDAEFGAVRLRAFGSYAMRIADAKKFFSKIVGTRGTTTTDEVTGQIRSAIVSGFSDVLGEGKIPALDLAAKYDEMSRLTFEKLRPELEEYGLELVKFFVENVSLPKEVEAALDTRSKLGILGDKMAAYAQMKAADAIEAAVSNPGGLAGMAASLSLGVGMGNVMGQAVAPLAQAVTASPGAAPPAPPAPGAVPRWSLAIHGQTSGPYTDQQVTEMLVTGRIAADAQVWRPGASGWAPLASYPEFASVAMPPPPPPPPPAPDE